MKKVKCKYCGININYSGLKRHQRSIRCMRFQNNRNRYECKYCRNTFTSNQKRDNHEISCNAIGLFYEFKSYRYLHDKELNDLKKELNDKNEELMNLKNQLNTYRTITGV